MSTEKIVGTLDDLNNSASDTKSQVFAPNGMIGSQKEGCKHATVLLPSGEETDRVLVCVSDERRASFSINDDGNVVILLSCDVAHAPNAVLAEKSAGTSIPLRGQSSPEGFCFTLALETLAKLRPSITSEKRGSTKTLLLGIPVEIWTPGGHELLASGDLPTFMLMRAARSIERRFANPDLASLRGEPRYRGALEKFGETEICGWSLDAAALKPVELNLELEGFSLGTISTHTHRPDIQAIIGLPISAGFVASASLIRLNVPTALIELLTQIGERHPTYRPDFVVRAGDSNHILPPLPGVQTSFTCAEWATFLHVKLEDAQSPLAAKADLIKSLTHQKSAEVAVKLIAFYLPQYHPTAENDAWWGPGFTEWTNVSVAKPLFKGHYQPHIPADLGFYDLRLAETRQAQADLARQYGIHGFCYYYYWFSGRRILERPLQAVLDSGEPNFPFCICWANESWSRRWDGSENELLIAQEHDPEKDAKLIDDILPLIKDPRYITVKGEPLLIIYRVGLLPDPKKVFAVWKKVARANGLPGLHICMAETFGADNPHQYGCDSAVEFPPHRTTSEVINKDIEDLPDDYLGNIYDYQQIIQNDMISRQPDSYPRYRTVMPSWDNTSRRGKSGNLLLGSTPELYETWLQYVVTETKSRFSGDQRLVFINAWNEWAEGAHLEPDRVYGRKYLEATRRALVDQSDWRVLLDGLRIRGQVAPEDMEDIIQVLGARFSGLQSSVDFLSRKLRNPAIAWGQSVFTDRLPLALANRPVMPAGEFAVDRLNQYWSGKWHVLLQSEYLSLEGWSYVQGVYLGSTSNTFLTLLNVDGGPSYYAVAWDRVERLDVVETKGAFETDALWSGFRVTASLANVSPGEYAIAMTYSARECVYRAVSTNRLLVV